MTKEEAIEYLKRADVTVGREIKTKTAEALEMAIKALAERKTGKWFDTADAYDKRAGKHDYFCSECKTHAMNFICGSEDWWCGKTPKYCPNCGAKMEGANE